MGSKTKTRSVISREVLTTFFLFYLFPLILILMMHVFTKNKKHYVWAIPNQSGQHTPHTRGYYSSPHTSPLEVIHDHQPCHVVSAKA